MLMRYLYLWLHWDCLISIDCNVSHISQVGFVLLFSIWVILISYLHIDNNILT
ncbi:hypothetical protein BDB01DRAFT_774818 [Pilobolus umbonatus]|nr:hypothetical protein BDB01DRAFT_774818 [Pilobolus umbonatus]